MATYRGISIEFKAIKPGQMKDAAAILSPVLSESKKLMKEAENLFDQATATWRHKPKWNIKTTTRKNDLVVRLYTMSKPFTYVERGTRVRWRRLSPDFSPKSRVRTLRAYAGSGKATGFYSYVPGPGIEPRDFRVEVAKVMEPIAMIGIGKAVNRGTRDLFKGGEVSGSARRL